jgi:arginase
VPRCRNAGTRWAESGRLLGLEFTEINPILDERNRTALAAVEFALSALGKTVL